MFEVWSGQLLCSLITRGKRRGWGLVGGGKGKREGEIERRGGTSGERRKGEEEPERGRRSNCPASLRHCLRVRRASWRKPGSSEGRTVRGRQPLRLRSLTFHSFSFSQSISPPPPFSLSQITNFAKGRRLGERPFPPKATKTSTVGTEWSPAGHGAAVLRGRPGPQGCAGPPPAGRPRSAEPVDHRGALPPAVFLFQVRAEGHSAVHAQDGGHLDVRGRCAGDALRERQSYLL